MTDFGDFSTLLRDWKAFYRTKEITYIAIMYSGIWYLLYSRTLFHLDQPLNIPPIQIETPSIRVGQFRLEITEDSASQIMEDVLADPGRVTFGKWTIGLSDREATIDRFDRLYPTRAPGQLRLPTYVRNSGAVDLRNVKDVLSLELLACDQPYESLEELCSQLMVPIAPGELAQMTHIEIILGNLFRFDDASSLREGCLNLIIAQPPLIEREKIKVSVKAFFAVNSPPRRFVISSSDFNATERAGKFYSECRLEMPDVHLALVIVSYGGQFCHKWWLRDRSKSFSPRYQIHRLLDQHEKFERTFLDSKNEFEHRVGLLLSLLNLTILPYGRIPELQDAPDILAYSGNNDLYVVECTTGDIDQKGKLQRLCDRTRDIANRVDQSVVSIANIFPVVFTSLPRTDIAPHLAKLEALRISVFCREDIEIMLKRVEAPPTPDEVRTAVQALTPSAGASANRASG